VGLLTAAFTHRQLQRSAWERIERGKTAATLPSAGAAVGSEARGATAPTGEERGGTYRVATRTACFKSIEASVTSVGTHDNLQARWRGMIF